eukprot:TRINITY_DN12847_c0_g1_i9.p1 TRINITY_DN12847_c0_g1~~TRINITY_DN12847_c0_g1_i9.p1  ORF type:complete len:288 (-),score=45.68 TRINITY_DN12847_c0_g1_i9:239-1102(-)
MTNVVRPRAASPPQLASPALAEQAGHKAVWFIELSGLEAAHPNPADRLEVLDSFMQLLLSRFGKVEPVSAHQVYATIPTDSRGSEALMTEIATITGCEASIGAGPARIPAFLASKLVLQPPGHCHITEECTLATDIETLPIGWRAKRTLATRGIQTCGELMQQELDPPLHLLAAQLTAPPATNPTAGQPHCSEDWVPPSLSQADVSVMSALPQEIQAELKQHYRQKRLRPCPPKKKCTLPKLLKPNHPPQRPVCLSQIDPAVRWGVMIVDNIHSRHDQKVSRHVAKS